MARLRRTVPNDPGPSETAGSAEPAPRRRLAGAVAAVVTALTLAVFVPWHRGLTMQPQGDLALAEDLAPHLDFGYRHTIAAAVIERGDARFVGWGADEHTEFEIGSITKTFTAALLADSIERGELTADTPLHAVFDELQGTSVGEVTMEQLATQHSGIPKQEDLVRPLNLWKTYLRIDPYSAEDVATMIDRVADVEVEPGSYVYSNTGFGLLGHAIAHEAGMDYPELVRDRLLEPLGMEETIVPETPADLPADSPAGYTDSGLMTGPWTLGGRAPAGSIRSTAHDMALWMDAVVDDTAPGAEATEPRTDLEDGQQIGFGWIIDTDDGSEITWHNGGTGGYRSYAGSASDGTSLVVLTDTESSADDAAGYLKSTTVETE